MMPEFETYNGRAKRVIFFARYEAGGFGSPLIESEHLLLGLMAEDWELVHSFLGLRGSLQSIREKIKTRTRIHERISTSIPLPFSEECAVILKYAEEEAIRRNESRIDSVHMVLGILRAESCTAARIFQESILEDSAMSNEAGIETSAFGEEVNVSYLLNDLIEALDEQDAKRVSLFFEEDGQFIDVQGELWVGRTDIEKMASSHLSSLNPSGSRGKIQEVRFVGRDSAVASLVWERENDTLVAGSAPFSMTVVLHHRQKIWRAVKAVLIKRDH